MIEVLLLLLSIVVKLVLWAIFFVYGLILSSIRWELRKYIRSVALINDVQMNVTGKYALNQALSKTPSFGHRLRSVSTSMYMAELHPYGTRWWNRVNKIDKDHFKKAFESHFEEIRIEWGAVTEIKRKYINQPNNGVPTIRQQ